MFPPADRPEVAFTGRSNVGKSSLLNRLVNRRGLAKTSRTPGRTRLINFFDVADHIYLVDLPGFGYADVPLSERASWRPMVESYLSADRDLRMVCLLVDIRRDPGAEESALLEWLARRNLTGQVVVTKVDKISRGRRAERLASIRRSLDLSYDPVAFSATTGENREELAARLTAACSETINIDPTQTTTTIQNPLDPSET
ncbi:MAG: YihA family ribosome biogenesis GTP-binding protein [Deltaproteobacteria bacterium]|nr:YihA family ribosome biogenesis GTP-binding protein [Deltaproteobacteria bacterium]